MTEEKKRINVFVPADLHAQVMRLGFATSTEAIIRGFECLLKIEGERNTKGEDNKANTELVISLHDRIQSLEDQLKVKDEQISTKDTQIKDLTDTMQAQAVQVQTLIHQKAIEAPGAKKQWWRFW
jgi:chromosome segregation ATPase